MRTVPQRIPSQRTFFLLLVACIAIFATAAAHAQKSDDTTAPQIPAAALAGMRDGAQFEARRQLTSAVDRYKTAMKAAGGKCVPCLEALARVQLRMEAYKESAATAGQLAALAPDPRARAQAEFQQGLALFQLYLAQNAGQGTIEKNEKRALATLKQAEPVVKQGELDDPANAGMHMLSGLVLAALKRDEEASRAFIACAATPGASAAECVKARHFASDVSLARAEPAPAFSIETMDGRRVSLESLAGKVVLLDFWATWCKFCERDSDYVQSMLDSFDKDKFVLLEISVDESEAVWKNYVRDKRLKGEQTRDETKAVGELFHVTGYPTYVVIDGDGMVRLRAVGIDGDLKGTVRKLLATPPAAAPDTRQPLPRSGAE